MIRRKLGRSGIEVGAIGMGCWAMGGPAFNGEQPIGWGAVDDEESIRAIDRAIELGADFFDTANVYGCGHSERVLGEALKGRRNRVVIASKFGHCFEDGTSRAGGQNAEPDYIRQACEDSLKRLGTDVIDLYQFHLGGYDIDRSADVQETLEGLVEQGKIRFYGWSTDRPESVEAFADGEHFTSVQQRLNIFDGSAETLALCEQHDLASINRGPLAMGLLTGKFTADSTIAADDVRRNWDLKGGDQAEQLKKLDGLRDVLTADGRSLAQGALCWLLARSEKTIPIPGFKTVAQVEDNAGAMAFGPLSADQMQQIDEILEGS